MSTQHFTDHELRCRCGCGEVLMADGFMRRLESIRVAYAKPMRLTSAYRCPAHDKEIGGAGVHPTGRAVDVLVSGGDARRLLEIAVTHGITGVGVSQRGPHGSRFLHLDDTHGPTRPWVWSY